LELHRRVPMSKIMLTVGFAVAMPLLALANVTKEEIKKLVSAGISDEVILTYIRTHGPVVPLSADDLVDLKRAGAGDRLLAGLVGSPATPAAAQAPAPPVVAAPAAPAGSYTETVVAPSYAYVSPAYYAGYPYYYSSYYYPYYPYYYSGCYPRYYYSGCYPRYYYGGYGCYPRGGVSVGSEWGSAWGSPPTATAKRF
jgi:hypothetical protein